MALVLFLTILVLDKICCTICKLDFVLKKMPDLSGELLFKGLAELVDPIDFKTINEARFDLKGPMVI